MIFVKKNYRDTYLFLNILFGVPSFQDYIIIKVLDVAAAASDLDRENIIFPIRRGGLVLFHIYIND